MSESTTQYPPVPPDDLKRALTIARPDSDRTLPHIGLVGDTYTITVSGEDTAGRFCVIDMHIPPGGGPAPHRHDFEETFILLDGEMEATFRGKKSLVRAGDTINIPANAPHQFHNSSSKPVRLLCICSPSGARAFLQGSGSACSHSHDRPTQTRQRTAATVHGESQGSCSEVPYRAAEGSIAIGSCGQMQSVRSTFHA
jgi:quercetin dioxygenase-like cupin family protein